MILCIDANIFVWGIKKISTNGQDDMVERAEYFFEWADSRGHVIMIPTIVLAEALAPEPLEKYPVIMDKLSKGFMIVDFDQRCASRYGVLFMNRIDELKAAARDLNIDNQKMKCDHLIIACALTHGASVIYSNDKGIKSFGQKHIEVRNLPEKPPPALVQAKLSLDQD